MLTAFIIGLACFLLIDRRPTGKRRGTYLLLALLLLTVADPSTARQPSSLQPLRDSIQLLQKQERIKLDYLSARLLASFKTSDTATQITAGDHPPILFCNNKQLEADLKARYSKLVKVERSHSLLDLLWNTQSRPASLIVDSLGSLVLDFRSAGAVAVVGTEGDIMPDMAAKFVSEVLHDLYEEKKTLGEAIRLFNRKLFQSKNPLAFAFTCFEKTT